MSGEIIDLKSLPSRVGYVLSRRPFFALKAVVLYLRILPLFGGHRSISSSQFPLCFVNMDPLSTTASILAILDTTEKVVKYGLDFAGAIKEIRTLRENLETLESLLTRLLARCEDVVKDSPDVPPPWLRGLWEVRSRNFDKDGVYVYEYKGILAQLQQVIEDMSAQLNPSKDYKKSEAYQRATWHYKRDKFTEMHTTITRCCGHINTILALNNDETLNETLDLMKENSEYAKLQLSNIDNRLLNFEVNQKREEERRRGEEEEKEREAIAAWLSPFSFIAKQDELWTMCFKETGEWLWQDQRFKAWAEGSSWYLQCVGAPGVGKTVLSSILTRHLPSKPEQSRPILSIYLDHKSSSVQTLPHLVGSLLQQMIQLDESFFISEDLRNVYKKAKRLQSKPISYSEAIQRILVAELDRYDRFYIIVDGFDELPPRDRVALQRELRKLQPKKGSLVITTRPINEQITTGTYECNRCGTCDLTLAFRCKVCDQGNYDLCYDCKQNGHWCLDRSHDIAEPYGEIEIEIKIPHSDIERYVRREIGIEVEDDQPVLRDERDELAASRGDPNTTLFHDLCQKDPSLPEQIVSEVTNKANGRFLFARLYMDSLRTKSNVMKLKKALRNIPDNINDIYKDAMQRIQAQESEDRNRAYKILGLITRARRPLSLKELQHALAVIDLQDDENYTETDILDAIDEPKAILGATSALVILENNGSEVRLVHRSLEDYLHLKENREKWFSTAEIDIAKACMTYLDLVLPRKPSSDDYFASKNTGYPFLQYASQYWGEHVRDAELNTEHGGADALAAVLRLISDPQRKDACMQAAWVTNPGGYDTWDVRRNVDKLHICAWFGLHTVLSEIDPGEGLVDVVEPKYGQTPLMYACRKGHFEVTRQLLRLGASQQKVSANGRTALFEAVLGHHTGGIVRPATKPSKHSEVVKLLVATTPQDLDVNTVHKQEFNRTALMLAARLGDLEIIQILLNHQDIKIDLQDLNGMTALYLAARETNYDVVELLLKASASIETVDFHAGRSALRCAAERDHHFIVDLLLQYGADPRLQDREGGTAMLRAVNRGAKQALETMMSYPIDLQCADEDGQSLLHGAARNGYHEIARLLMEDRTSLEKGLSPNIRDKFDMTPLHDASQRGELAVLSVLLEKGADPSAVDRFGRTPFTVAWQYGRPNIMSVLAASGHGQQPSEDLDETQLPVWSMARRGLTLLVAEAIKIRMHDLHVPEPYTENSALHCAVEASEPDILYMLLETRNLPVNKPNHFQRTPLHAAALVGDLLATNILIDHGANLDMKDRWNDEAIVLAQANQHLEIMLALIEAKATIDKRKIDTKRLFFFAVEQGNVASAQILINHGVDRSVQNNDGVRALQIATAADDEDMMMLLKSASTVNFRDIANERKIGFMPFRSRPMQL